MVGVSPLFVAIAEIQLHLPGARSLKEKRQDLRSLIDRLRSRHHILVLECDHQELHQRAGVALCSFVSEETAGRTTIQRALDTVHETFAGVVLDERTSVVQVR